MAQRFSKPLYNSKEWRQDKSSIHLSDDRYLCVICGAPAQEVHHVERLTPDNINDISVALNSNNLVSLCKDCHFKEHEREKLAGLKGKSNKDTLNAEYMFDKNGQVVLVEE